MSQSRRIAVLKTFSQEDFDSFATLSGDNNPIHTDPEFCAATRFGRTVAHGLLLCSVLRGLIEQLIPGARLGEQEVMFPAPTYTNEPMLFCVEVTDTRDGKVGLELEVKRQVDGVITCQGRAGVLV